MSTTETQTALLASCSFCKKDNTQVKKLIAGPGVYICDECVALCDDILAQEADPGEEAASQARHRFQNPTAEELLARIEGLAGTLRGMERDLERWVTQAHDQLGITWDNLGARLGIDPSVARERFNPRP